MGVNLYELNKIKNIKMIFFFYFLKIKDKY